MARIGAKQPVSVGPGVAYLERLSKSALIDVIIDAIQRDIGDELHVVCEQDAQDYVSPVLRMRGDRISKTAEEQAEEARKKGEAKARFRNARRIEADREWALSQTTIGEEQDFGA